jgi:hypothetical protein
VEQTLFVALLRQLREIDTGTVRGESAATSVGNVRADALTVS